jgi:hypothetical protein
VGDAPTRAKANGCVNQICVNMIRPRFSSFATAAAVSRRHRRDLGRTSPRRRRPINS